MSDIMKRPIPVTVLTGFLGAGKTTLLQHLLCSMEGRRVSALVNDFGALNIDAALVRRVGADAIALTNGCVCCNLSNDLLSSVLSVTNSEDRPDHVVIEASGIAQPSAIVETLRHPLLHGRVEVEATVAVVDADAFPRMGFEDGELALAQMVMADLIIANKCDLVSPTCLDELESQIRIISPHARVVRTTRCLLPPAVVIGIGEGKPGKDAVVLDTAVNAKAYQSHGSRGFSTVSWSSPGTVDPDSFASFVHSLPSDVIRAKGFVRFGPGQMDNAVFQLTGRRSELVYDADLQIDRNVIVFIGRHIDERALTSAMNACVSTVCD